MLMAIARAVNADAVELFRQAMRKRWRRFESGERRGEGVEIGAVAKAMRVDPMALRKRKCRPQDRMDCAKAATLTRVRAVNCGRTIKE